MWCWLSCFMLMCVCIYLTSHVFFLNPKYLKMLTLNIWCIPTYSLVLFSSGHWLQYLQFCIIGYMYSLHLNCYNITLESFLSHKREMWILWYILWDIGIIHCMIYVHISWSCCICRNLMWCHSSYSWCHYLFSTAVDVTWYGCFKLDSQCCVIPHYIVWIYSWPSYE